MRCCKCGVNVGCGKNASEASSNWFCCSRIMPNWKCACASSLCRAVQPHRPQQLVQNHRPHEISGPEEGELHANQGWTGSLLEETGWQLHGVPVQSQCAKPNSIRVMAMLSASRKCISACTKLFFSISKNRDSSKQGWIVDWWPALFQVSLCFIKTPAPKKHNT